MKKTVLVLLLVAVAAVLLWTPDTAHEQMVAKYGQTPSRFIELESGTTVHYRDQGNPDAPTLLLIHGTSASLHTWEPMIESLGQEFRFVSLDLLGHGLSGTTSKRDYSHDAQIAMIWGLMDHLQIPSSTLVGNSFGGGIAWRAALDQPQRVKSLILFAPSGAPRREVSSSNIGFRLLATSFGRAIIKQVTPRWIIKKSLKQTFYKPEFVDKAMVDRYWELLRKSGNRQAMIDLTAVRRVADDWQRLQDIEAATLLIWGNKDTVLPVSMAETFLTTMPNIDYLEMPDVGHIPMEEAAVASANAIRVFCGSGHCPPPFE